MNDAVLVLVKELEGLVEESNNVLDEENAAVKAVCLLWYPKPVAVVMVEYLVVRTVRFSRLFVRRTINKLVS